MPAISHGRRRGHSSAGRDHERNERLGSPQPDDLAVKRFHFCPRPRGAAEKLQGRFDAWLVVEAADFDPPAQLGPALTFDEMLENGFERFPVQRVA